MAKQLIITAVLVGGLLATYVFLTEEVPSFDVAEQWTLPRLEHLTKIEIIRGDTTIALAVTEDGWRVTQPIDYAADPEIFSSIATLARKTYPAAISISTSASSQTTRRHHNSPIRSSRYDFSGGATPAIK